LPFDDKLLDDLIAALGLFKVKAGTLESIGNAITG